MSLLSSTRLWWPWSLCSRIIGQFVGRPSAALRQLNTMTPLEKHMIALKSYGNQQRGDGRHVVAALLCLRARLCWCSLLRISQCSPGGHSRSWGERHQGACGTIWPDPCHHGRCLARMTTRGRISGWTCHTEELSTSPLSMVIFHCPWWRTQAENKWRRNHCLLYQFLE